MAQTHVKDLLSGYLDEQVSAQEQARIRRHLDQCEDCRRHLEELRRTVALLQTSEPVRAPEGFRATVHSKVEEVASQPKISLRWPRLRWSWRTAGAVAAALLVGIFSVNLLRQQLPVGALREEPRDIGGLRSQKAADATRQSNAPVASEAPQSVAGVPTIPSLRRVIRHAQLYVEVEDFDAAARRLMQIAEDAGGFVADSSFTESGGVPQGYFTLRVPTPRFASTVNAVEQIGKVLQRRATGQDVTEEFIDLQARVRNLERHELRLLAFMDRAVKVSDLLAIEQEVARVRGEIERLTGRLRFIDHRVELATIEATVQEKAKRTSVAFWDVQASLQKVQAAFLATLRTILSAIEKTVVLITALVPVLLLVAAAWLVIRRIRRVPV